MGAWKSVTQMEMQTLQSSHPAHSWPFENRMKGGYFALALSFFCKPGGGGEKAIFSFARIFFL